MKETKNTNRLDFTERNRMLTQLALKHAVSNPMKRIGHVKVFFLKEGWQAEWLKQEESIVQPANFSDLKEVLEDTLTKTIYITDQIFVPVAALQFLCEKSPVEKILFLEGEDNA